MTLSVGTQLDRYEITGFVGRGAMGEVYRARDARLGREVAVKMLPPAFAADEERLRRFDQEARAAGALNHPNVVALYDVGTHEGAPFVVAELLHGETLRDRLAGASLPPRKVAEIGAQVARGLAAAHAKGIVHRDLKPENLFVTGEGHVKILDFGLAKLTRADGGSATGLESVLPTMTEFGRVLGTVGYMAPEQVRGEAVDHRADIFALGCVLYEMATGSRPFQREAAVDTLAAIVRDELPEFGGEVGRALPGLVPIVRRCVEKQPGERFQSARDLAFALELLAAAADAQAGAAEAAGAPAFGFAPGTVTFKRITFRRGFIPSARFTPDGHSVIYSAAWEGKPLELFWSHIGNPEARSLGLRDTDLAAVSATNELAVLLRTQWLSPFYRAGTLARLPPMGGAARELLHGVFEADWAPDANQLAVLRSKEGMSRIEYPVGTVLHQTAGWVSQMRISPDGNLIAFFDHPNLSADAGNVCVLDRRGQLRVLSGEWGTTRGLAWSPDGREVWFTADREGSARGLWAVTLEGAHRVVLQLASNLTLHDISRDGHVLLAHGPERAGISALEPGGARERDLSWLDWSLLKDISPDGRQMLFDESGEGGGATGSVYLRPMDGSPAMRLGDGIGRAISPDGSWVLSSLLYAPTGDVLRGLMMLPTGVGEPRTIPLDGLTCHAAGWLPDSRSVIAATSEHGRGIRLHRVDVHSGERRPISDEGIDQFDSHMPVRGDEVAAHSADRGHLAFSLSGGEPAPIACLNDQDRLVRWSKDGRAMFVYRPNEFPARIYRVELESGERSIWRQLTPPDPTGIYRIARVCMSDDEQAYGYTYYMQLLDLHVVEGLK